jgi:hypothetical protein
LRLDFPHIVWIARDDEDSDEEGSEEEFDHIYGNAHIDEFFHIRGNGGCNYSYPYEYVYEYGGTYEGGYGSDVDSA